MEYVDKNFTDFKKQTLSKLHHALNNDLVDNLVISILNHINKHEEYITTSSCAGRIILMELPKVGDKKNAVFHGRWHGPVSNDEIQQGLKNYKKEQLWFIAQAPIFHIAAANLKSADKLVKLGVSSGFKHSGFKSVQDRIIVELVSTERMDVPIGWNGSIFVSEDYIEQLHLFGNDLMKRCKEKLDRLEKNIKTL